MVNHTLFRVLHNFSRPKSLFHWVTPETFRSQPGKYQGETIAFGWIEDTLFWTFGEKVNQKYYNWLFEKTGTWGVSCEWESGGLDAILNSAVWSNRNGVQESSWNDG
jgi:hypothetical protein